MAKTNIWIHEGGAKVRWLFALASRDKRRDRVPKRGEPLRLPAEFPRHANVEGFCRGARHHFAEPEQLVSDRRTSRSQAARRSTRPPPWCATSRASSALRRRAAPTTMKSGAIGGCSAGRPSSRLRPACTKNSPKQQQPTRKMLVKAQRTAGKRSRGTMRPRHLPNATLKLWRPGELQFQQPVFAPSAKAPAGRWRSRREAARRPGAACPRRRPRSSPL